MYKFRREDNGEIVEVDFETMMGQSGGYITLTTPDAYGVRAKRIMEEERKPKVYEHHNANQTPPPSDVLGVTAHQVEEMRMDARENGFTGVEFKPEPGAPFFYQAHFSSHKERDDYIRHRGMVDRNRTKGAALTPDALRDAEELAKRIY